jgi:hypothetical protein
MEMFMILNSASIVSAKLLQNSESETYTYKEKKIKIITVFDNSIALVEDENGELFEVEKNALR